jgi:hypothetical protein
LTRDPESISAQRTDVPLPLNALIMRCLAKDPDGRPQTAGQLVAELDALVTMSGDFSPMRDLTRRRMPVYLGAAAVVAIAGLTWYAWQRGRETIPPPAPVVQQAEARLTHADSVAIARAVDQKLAERAARADAARGVKSDSAEPKAATPAATTKPAVPAVAVADAAAQARANDSLRGQMMREVIDSIRKMQALALGTAGTAGAAGARGRGPTFVQVPRFDSLFPRKPSSLSATAFAERAANLGPPRRVFVSVPATMAGNAAASAAAATIMDTLRVALSHNPRYQVISRDSSAGALTRSRTTDSIAKMLDVELFASLQWHAIPDGHANWQITVRDLGAHAAYSNRITSARVPSDSLLSATDSLIARSVRALAELDHAPRKASPRG